MRILRNPAGSSGDILPFIRPGVASSLRPRRFRGRTVASLVSRLLECPTVARACRAIAAQLRCDEWEQSTCREVEALVGRARTAPARRQLTSGSNVLPT